MTDPLWLNRIDHRSEYGSWTLLRRVPSLWLRPFVHEIQGYEEEGGQPVLRKELPSGVVPMILVCLIRPRPEEKDGDAGGPVVEDPAPVR